MPNNKVPFVTTQDREINQLQSNIIPVLNSVQANPLINGILLQSIAVATGENTINHGLSRNLIGWIITKTIASSAVTFYQQPGGFPDKNFILVSSGDATIDLFVF